jgi:hypothetical protein
VDGGTRETTYSVRCLISGDCEERCHLSLLRALLLLLIFVKIKRTRDKLPCNIEIGIPKGTSEFSIGADNKGITLRDDNRKRLKPFASCTI